MGRAGCYPILHQGPERVTIAGSFVTVGAGDPTVKKGMGFTVTRPGAGRYVVTLRTPVAAFDAIVPSVAAETPGTPLFAQVDQDLTDTDSFEIQVSTHAGALADDAGSEVSFIAVARIGSHNP